MASTKRVITAETVSAAHGRGERSLLAPPEQFVITPEAWSRASELGVTLERQKQPARRPPVGGRVSNQQAGGCERAVDPSGAVVVRGSSVRLGRFEPAGADRNVRLLDVVTGQDRSPMTAGFMSWGRSDSFDWQLDYDEVDYVLEGVLHLGIDGRVLEARASDVVSIPKGSRVRFGTPSRVRLFYVTYPADWAKAAEPAGLAPPRKRPSG